MGSFVNYSGLGTLVPTLTLPLFQFCVSRQTTIRPATSFDNPPSSPITMLNIHNKGATFLRAERSRQDLQEVAWTDHAQQSP